MLGVVWFSLTGTSDSNVLVKTTLNGELMGVLCDGNAKF